DQLAGQFGLISTGLAHRAPPAGVRSPPAVSGSGGSDSVALAASAPGDWVAISASAPGDWVAISASALNSADSSSRYSGTVARRSEWVPTWALRPSVSTATR